MYEKLFQLNFQHDYFNQSNATKAIQLMPLILDNSSVINFKATNEGVFLYRQKPAKALNTEPVTLVFPIQFIDPLFINYTDIDFQANKIFYFEYTQNEKTSINTADALALDLYPSIFSYSVKALQDEDRLKAIYLDKPDSEEKTLVKSAPAKMDELQLDLTDHPDGKYQLFFEFEDSSKNYTDSFFVSDTLYQKPPSAVLIWKGDLSTKNIDQITYTLSFKSRSVFYNYIFPNVQSEEDWKETKINSFDLNNQTVQFNKKEATQKLSNGAEGYSAMSDVAIPLYERPPWNIKLNTSQIPQGLSLPYPSPNQPFSEMEGSKDAKAYYASMYVYL